MLDVRSVDPPALGPVMPTINSSDFRLLYLCCFLCPPYNQNHRFLTGSDGLVQRVEWRLCPLYEFERSYFRFLQR